MFRSSRQILRNLLLFHLPLLSIDCSPHPDVLTGLDRVGEFHDLFSGRRIGIITNHTARNREGEHIVDIFFGMEAVMVTDLFLREDTVHVTALFGPEHGIRGDDAAGEAIDHETDTERNIPVYSLYGSTQKPTPAMLRNVDILVYDIQDIGARFYTYIYTMALAMEAAAESSIPFVVLDRPNPIGGRQVEGPVLEPEFASFIGLYPIPVRHGMTSGELAGMINGEGWLAGGIRADLTVVPCRNWRRRRWFDETGLTWRKTSPNMPTLEIATVYPGTCLFEGTNVSEGRGTEEPFLRIGAPWIEPDRLISALRAGGMPGVEFHPVRFTPEEIPGTAPYPKYENEPCGGIRLRVVDREAFRPFLSGLALVQAVHDLYPGRFEWRASHFDRLCGTDAVRRGIEEGFTPGRIQAGWSRETESYREKREAYLLYR